jgi:hypothetical protein
MRRRELLLLVALAAVIVVAAFLAHPSMLSGTDFLRIHSFYKPYLAEAWRSGRALPLWNPHVNLGRPFLADADSGLLYPPDLLYLVCDVQVAWSILAVLHVGLAMVGMTQWLRALGVEARASLLLAAILPLVAPLAEPMQSGLIHYTIGLCYLPWIFVLAMRLQDSPAWGTAALLAVMVALQYLGGHPQASWITLVGVSVFLVGRRLERPWPSALRTLVKDLLRAWGAFAWGLAAAAVQILPTLELAGQGNRHTSLAFSASFALPPVGLLSLLEPVGPRFPLDNTSSLFCGTAVLVAGVAALVRPRERNLRALVGLALFSVLLALGERTPFFRLCYELLPGCASFRLHSRMMVMVALALLAGTGLFVSRPADARGGDVRFALVSATVLVAAVLLALGVLPGPLPPEGWAMPASRFLLAALSVLLLVAWQLRHRHSWGRVAGIALLVVVVGELSLSLRGIKTIRADAAPDTTERALADLLETNQLLRPGAAPPRVSFPMPYVRENAGMKLGFSSFAGYVSLTLDRVFAFMYGMRGLREPLSNAFPASNVYGGGPFPFASMNLELGFDPERRVPFLNQRPDPRLYLATQYLVVAHWRQALEHMQRGHDFHKTVLLEQDLALPAGAGPDALPSSATIVGFAPERVQMEIRSPVPAYLVLKEAWYPGWSATVDGRPAPCVPGNVWMRVVPVPAGTHQVVLELHSRMLGWGAALSSLSGLGFLLVALRRRRRRPAGPRASP